MTVLHVHSCLGIHQPVLPLTDSVEEVDTDEAPDETGLDAKHIELVATQANVSRAKVDWAC
jgi:NACalpha-BTF3-like transcription factor